MKRTLTSIKWNALTRKHEVQGRITCELTGEWFDGTKVWTDVETGHQYSMHRGGNREYYFLLEATA